MLLGLLNSKLHIAFSILQKLDVFILESKLKLDPRL